MKKLTTPDEEARLWNQYLVKLADRVNTEVMERCPIATNMSENFVFVIGGSHAGELQ
jgi:hypothetical protein